MSDLLLELRSEEIPARMQAGARADLEKLFRADMQAAGVAVGEVTVWSTPRRLALIARDLPANTEAVREETKGPRVGAPAQALEGFLRKTGLAQDQLQDRGGTYFAVAEKPGRAVKVVLVERLPLIIWKFPWPKSMRWGDKSLSMESLRWVRPLSGVVAILGDDVLEIDFDVGHVYANKDGEVDIRKGESGLISGAQTLGHRFHHPGPITIGSATDYQEKLRACHVIVDHAERQDLIRTGAAKAAADAGLALVEDEGLVIENAGLTEWPVPLLGRFDEAFLDVPPEVIQLTARVNQMYFVCTAPLPLAGGAGGGPEDGATPTPNPSREREGDLANAFVCTANIEAADGGAAIVDGNRKVLAARLSDARFFWEQDRKVPLAEQAKKLERITFHEKLGTLADKVERVAKLARWLVEEGIVKGADPDLAEQTARLAKADLVTEMVGEFPELQGVMGGYYARAEGLPDEVADAIRDHYKPVGQGDEVPIAPVTVAVSLADKLDTLAGFFAIEEKPTGSKDPFALRRAALAVLSIVSKNGNRMHLMPLFDRTADANRASSADYQNRRRMEKAKAAVGEGDGVMLGGAMFAHISRPFGPQKIMHSDTAHDLLDFLVDRLKVQQREAGVRHDLIDAVFALGNEDDLVRLLARVNALQNFVATEDGTNLLSAYKRAANILKKEDWQGAEGEIARTGEEDPLAQVDDPDLRPVIEAKLAEKKKNQLSYMPEPAEKALIEALDSAEPKAAAAVQAEDFEAAMAALASLRGPIDRFFDSVTVNDDDPAKREARLSLLARFRAAVHKVADFSKIEG